MVSRGLQNNPHPGNDGDHEEILGVFWSRVERVEQRLQYLEVFVEAHDGRHVLGENVFTPRSYVDEKKRSPISDSIVELFEESLQHLDVCLEVTHGIVKRWDF